MKRKNILQFLPKLKISFTPKTLAIIIAMTGIILSLPLGVFFSNTFTRYWKVNQKIIIAEQVVIRDIVAIPDIKIGDTQLTSYSSIVKFADIGLPPIEIPVVSLRWYSVCILIGVILGYMMALYLSHLNFISGTVVDRLLIGLIVFGLIGARFFFVIFSWDIFKEKPISIITEIGQGGMGIFGTISACSTYIWLYCKRYRFNFFEFVDFLAPSILTGQILGRFGNFFNYEGYGPDTALWWKMYVPENGNIYGGLESKYFHPTFLYEIIPNFFLLVYLLWIYKDSTHKNSGLIFAKYAMGYGFIRFICEFFRLDSLKIWLPTFIRFDFYGIFKFEYLMVSQVCAFLLFLIGYLTWKKRHRVIYLKKDMTELFI